MRLWWSLALLLCVSLLSVYVALAEDEDDDDGVDVEVEDDNEIKPEKVRKTRRNVH